MEDPRIRRAIISLTDKTGVVEFARSLSEEFDVEIISTGGTARVLQDAGIPVTPIEEYTGFPEMMDGRVKTLHPRVHGGLLARRDLESHMQDARENGIDMIVFGTALGPSIGSALREWGNANWGDGGGYKVTFIAAAICCVLSLIPSLLVQNQRALTREEREALGPWYKNIVALPAIPPAARKSFSNITATASR